MELSFDEATVATLLSRVTRLPRPASLSTAEDWQPVHTVYGGAHLFKSGTAGRLGELAWRSLLRYASDPDSLANCFNIADAALAQRVFTRLVDKLNQRAVEDYRLDFEDGYGYRTDIEEDEHAGQAAGQVASALAAGSLPPGVGIRIKPLSAGSARRALRTLDIFMTELQRATVTPGALPAHFVVTLPKVEAAEEVAVLAAALTQLEQTLHLPANAVGIEVMVESPRALVGRDGRLVLGDFVDAAAGRCHSVHLGAYDYTASCGVVAAEQGLHHPACDWARQAMQVALHERGVRLSDGATHIIPTEVYRQPADAAQEAANVAAVHGAWRAQFSNVWRALSQGIFQGWDLHPAQLVPRYAAVFLFFAQNAASSADRLQGFLQRAAQATLTGNVFDDAASAQGLINFYLRGIGCGALERSDAVDAGISWDELQSRSFSQIVARRLSPPPTAV